MTLYTAKSGAMVFAAGTEQFAWGLDAFAGANLIDQRAHPSYESASVQRLVGNVLLRFAHRDGFE
jgi:hypothetical protein